MPHMPSTTANPPVTYSPHLTDPHAVAGVEVKQNIADPAPPSKATPPDLQRVIAHIHDLGLHLVPARELHAAGGKP